MTTISAPRAAATPFESVLLRAASALDRFVATRLEQRGALVYRRATQARMAALGARDAAEARGAIGILPR